VTGKLENISSSLANDNEIGKIFCPHWPVTMKLENISFSLASDKEIGKYFVPTGQ
jgi:hypothetical protein